MLDRESADAWGPLGFLWALNGGKAEHVCGHRRRVAHAGHSASCVDSWHPTTVRLRTVPSCAGLFQAGCSKASCFSPRARTTERSSDCVPTAHSFWAGAEETPADGLFNECKRLLGFARFRLGCLRTELHRC